mmetsp:Transcript_18116/g.35372  ORF Transcript_18116/g.35372 Transcript_18116/m.35372 type:complete len:544 (+) Transcript_18116:142-1773(+)
MPGSTNPDGSPKRLLGQPMIDEDEPNAGRSSSFDPAAGEERVSDFSPKLGPMKGAATRTRWGNKSASDVAAMSKVEQDSLFAEMLEDLFPRAVPEQVFVEHMTGVLNKHGFHKDTSINLVSTCRDEICRPFTELLDNYWAHHFSISSLAGFVFCGRTGFKAAMAHAPVVDGKERYVFWVAPHIALSADGQVGKCFRAGREGASSACGALLGVLGELKSGKMSLRLDQTDVEQSLVKQELIGHLPYGRIPSLVELTYAAYECIVREIMETAKVSVNPNCEYVIVSGIQIHGPDGQNFFWPGGLTHVNETGKEIDLYEDYASAVSDWHIKLQGWNASEALMLLQKRRREARLAAKNGDLKQLTRIGINLGGVRDHMHRTLLHVAALCNQVEVVRHLVTTYPALVGHYDLDKCSAMDYAVDNHYDEVANLIKEHGGGIEGPHLIEGLTTSVRSLDLEGFARYVKFAKDREEAMEATDNEGHSLLHIAVNLQNVTATDKQEILINSLIGLGADTSAVDNYGNLVLHNVPQDRRQSIELVRERSGGLK